MKYIYIYILKNVAEEQVITLLQWSKEKKQHLM